MRRLMLAVYTFLLFWQVGKALAMWEAGGSSNQPGNNGFDEGTNTGFARARIRVPSTAEQQIDLSTSWEEIHRMVTKSVQSVLTHQHPHAWQAFPHEIDLRQPSSWSHVPDSNQIPSVPRFGPPSVPPKRQQAIEQTVARGPKRLRPTLTDDGIYEGLDDLPHGLGSIGNTGGSFAGLDDHFAPSTPRTFHWHPIAEADAISVPSNSHTPSWHSNTASPVIDASSTDSPTTHHEVMIPSLHPASVQHEGSNSRLLTVFAPPNRETEAAQLWNLWLLLGRPTGPDPRFVIEDSHKLNLARTTALLNTFTDSLKRLRGHLSLRSELILSEPQMFKDWILRASFRHIENKVQSYQRYNNWAHAHQTFLSDLAPKRADLDQGRFVRYIANPNTQYRVAHNLIAWYAEDFNHFLGLVSKAWYRPRLPS